MRGSVRGHRRRKRRLGAGGGGGGAGEGTPNNLRGGGATYPLPPIIRPPFPSISM